MYNILIGLISQRFDVHLAAWLHPSMCQWQADYYSSDLNTRLPVWLPVQNYKFQTPLPLLLDIVGNSRLIYPRELALLQLEYKFTLSYSVTLKQVSGSVYVFHLCMSRLDNKDIAVFVSIEQNKTLVRFTISVAKEKHFIGWNRCIYCI